MPQKFDFLTILSHLIFDFLSIALRDSLHGGYDNILTRSIRLLIFCYYMDDRIIQAQFRRLLI